MGPRKKKEMEKALEGVNLLGLAPRRAAEWEKVEGRVVVLRPDPVRGGFSGLMNRFLHVMSSHRIRLDEVGSFAWSHFDGSRTVAEVGELVRKEFGERVEPVEERLGHLVWAMRREGFLGYPGWDSEVSE